MLEELTCTTPARINVSRAGTRPKTDAWLAFRCDHALAKDAVDSELTPDFIATFAQSRDLPVIQSLAQTRAQYILYPTRGKQTTEQALSDLKTRCKSGVEVQVVISDGLSARAIEANAPDVLDIIADGLRFEKIDMGTPVVVRFGRVAIADQISHALQARIAINLIGERPGLSSARSMSAYITYNPGPQTISSDRTVVSNIHHGGTPPSEAGAYIIKLVKTILKHQVSGVRLQQLS